MIAMTQKKGTAAETNRSERSEINVGLFERWASVTLGTGLLMTGLVKRSSPGLLLILGGGALMVRGARGRCPLYRAAGRRKIPRSALELHQQLTVAPGPEEAYRFWRDTQNLPCFIADLAEVRTTGTGGLHWVSNRGLEGDLEIFDDRPGERIAWRSTPDSPIAVAGEVRFHPAPGNRGTEVHVRIKHQPPAGLLGASLARLFHPLGAHRLLEDLRRFKRLLETGELATTEGQPAGAGRARPPQAAGARDVVDEASSESFPASDAPTWTSSSL